MELDQIPSVLACDVGNTTIRLAHVKGEDVTGMQSVSADGPAGLGEPLRELWDAMDEPRKIVAGSVNPAALKTLISTAAKALGEEVLVIGQTLPLPIPTDLPRPGSIGVDRLCCASAAYDRLGVACVVADFGTAVTIDCVSEEGRFLGGAILPGLAMAAESLHTHTAQLPQVKLVEPDWVFGADTTQAIVGGLIGGARGALREFAEAYATELGHWPVVIVTGGDAELVLGHSPEAALVQAVVPDLVLRGVANAYYKAMLT